MVWLSTGSGQDSQRLIWASQDGRITPLTHPKGDYGELDLSPDEKQLVYTRSKDGVDNIWIMELATGRSSQLTFESANFGAIWHPSGKKIAFSTYRHGPYSVYEMPVDRNAPEQPVIIRNVDILTSAYTPDGKQMIIGVYVGDGFGDLFALSLDDTSHTYPIAAGPYEQASAAVHPGGIWVAYMSTESGSREIYIRPFSGSGNVVPVSVNGGSSPLWSTDGNTLYYWKGDKLIKVGIQTQPQLRIGEPEEMFEMPDVVDYDVTSDGRFIMVQGDPTGKPQLIAVTNWFEELKRLTESGR